MKLKFWNLKTKSPMDKIPVIGKVYKQWEKPSPTAYKKIRQSRTNKRLLIGSDFPTKIDHLNEGTGKFSGTFEGKIAHKDKIFDVTNKIKLSSKAKKMIQKDEKLTALYNSIDKQFNVGIQQDIRRKTKTNKTNSKKYNRR